MFFNLTKLLQHETISQQVLELKLITSFHHSYIMQDVVRIIWVRLPAFKVGINCYIFFIDWTAIYGRNREGDENWMLISSIQIEFIMQGVDLRLSKKTNHTTIFFTVLSPSTPEVAGW